MTLACLGGQAAFSTGHPGMRWPRIHPELESALSALETVPWSRSRVGSAKEDPVSEFEMDLQSYTGATQCLAVVNGTVAIELALRAIGVGPQDEVLVPASTFQGTVTPVLVVGGRPVAVDISRVNLGMDPSAAASAVTSRTRAAVVVHLAGIPAGVQELRRVLPRDVGIIEDCAQAFGTRINGNHVGLFGVCGTYSFHHEKQLAIGEGGALMSADGDTVSKASQLHDLSSRWRSGVLTQPPTNARLSTLQGLVGRVQLKYLEEEISTRQHRLGLLVEALGDCEYLNVLLPERDRVQFSPFSIPILYEPSSKSKLSRDDLVKCLRIEGLPVGLGHIEPFFDQALFREGPFDVGYPECPTARDLSRTALFLSHRFLLMPEDSIFRLAELITDAILYGDRVHESLSSRGPEK
jgi:perosamine synthetase